MHNPHTGEATASATWAHQLRFSSLFHTGRAVVVPCDAGGHVDMNALPERMRDLYLAARAMMGRDYAYPTLETLH